MSYYEHVFIARPEVAPQQVENIVEDIKKIVSKDSKGDPLKFEINILINYKIKDNDNLLFRNKIIKKNVYNNDSDQFKLEQTEDIILENLVENASDSIIASIISIDDN